MKEQIVLNGYWPKIIVGVWTLIITVAVPGIWATAIEFESMRKSVDTAIEKVDVATVQMAAVLVVHEQDQDHIEEDHQEFRDRLHSLEAGIRYWRDIKNEAEAELEKNPDNESAQRELERAIDAMKELDKKE